MTMFERLLALVMVAWGVVLIAKVLILVGR